MNIVRKDDLKNLCFQKKFMGSESNLYTCTYNNQAYVYKELYAMNNYLLDLYNSLNDINDSSLLIPKLFVFKDKIIGHLTEELVDYSLLFNLQKESYEEKIRVLKLIKDKIINMHKLGIIHLDLHTANVMYKGEDIKIIDFEHSSYKNISPIYFSKHSRDYLRKNTLSPSVDIYNFNIDTVSILYNVSWSDMFDFSFTFEDKLTTKQKEVWIKTKGKKELTSNDYLIDCY